MDLFDLYQSRQIKSIHRQVGMEASNNEHQRSRTRDDVELLNARIDGLKLACEAMWKLLQQNVHLTDQQLLDQIKALDLEDGELDGRRQAAAGTCVCGAKVNAKASICQFCGVEAPEREIFDAL